MVDVFFLVLVGHTDIFAAFDELNLFRRFVPVCFQLGHGQEQVFTTFHL